MPDLSTPLRVTWDLPENPGLTRQLWLAVARARVLFAELRLNPRSPAGLEGLVEGVAAAPGPRISLLGTPAEHLVSVAGLGAAFLSGCDLLVLPPHRPVGWLEGLGADPARTTLALWSTPEGLSHLPEAIETARDLGVGTLAVLNPPAPASPLTPAIRATARRQWRARGAPETALRVHDLFLAEAMGLDPFPTYPGCQAADALGHLTEDGMLVACRTLPEELGNPGERSVADIWGGSARRMLRERLTATPSDCRGCLLIPRCAGGCPGLSPGRGRDGSCAGPRPGERPEGDGS